LTDVFIYTFFVLIMLMSLLLGFLAFLVRMLFKRKAESKKAEEGYKVEEQCVLNDNEDREI